MPNSTYGTALSVTTFDDFSDKIWDLIIGRNKILRLMQANGFIEKKSGGANITKRLMYAENGTFDSASAYEAADLTPQEPFTAAVFAWKMLMGSFSLANLTIFQNSGSKHQISNIKEDLVMNAVKTGQLVLSRQVWADGTGNGGKDFGGIRYLNAAGVWGTVGGINSNTDTWWRNQTAATVGSFSANGILQMDTLYASALRDDSAPTMVVGDLNFRVYYGQSCLQLKRLVQPNKQAHDLGIPNIEYMGMPAFEDPNQTAGYIDMLSADTTSLVLGTDIGYRKSPMVSPVDQDVQTQLMVLYGNMATTDRSTNALAYGTTYP